MNETLQTAVTALQDQFLCELQVFRGEARIILRPKDILDALRLLREKHDFNILVDITAVDYWPEENPRFHVIYHLVSTFTNNRLELRVPLAGNVPILPTSEGIFAGANYYEREVWDMFGIRFEGHSDLRRIIMPYDWQGHPLRKDYPLGYEEVQFSFNFDEIKGRKPRGKENREESL